MSTITKLRGFRNLGNTCYMNSTLQALLSSNVLNTVLIMYVKRNPNCLDNLSPILIEYCRLMLDLIGNKVSNVYSPRPFKSALDKENPWFRGYQQHDSNELMQYMINEFADETKDSGMAKLVRKVCFGKYKQYVTCTECNKTNIDHFKFLDVLLPIPNKQNPDLEDCFIKFAENDKLDGDDKWKCPNCDKKVVAYKRMEIEDVPEVAIFTFNRFKGTSKNSKPIKIYEYIELEGKKLKLISTVNHYGGTGGGHYTAHVLKEDKWYKADDSTIREIPNRSILCDSSVYSVIYQVEC